jgi:hypothetical protein
MLQKTNIKFASLVRPFEKMVLKFFKLVEIAGSHAFTQLPPLFLQPPE